MEQCYSWGGAMGHRPIQQQNGPLTTEIAILNLERMAHWNFKFIGNKWKMAHTKVCPAITLDGMQVCFMHMRNLVLQDTFYKRYVQSSQGLCSESREHITEM